MRARGFLCRTSCGATAASGAGTNGCPGTGARSRRFAPSASRPTGIAPGRGPSPEGGKKSSWPLVVTSLDCIRRAGEGGRTPVTGSKIQRPTVRRLRRGETGTLGRWPLPRLSPGDSQALVRLTPFLTGRARARSGLWLGRKGEAPRSAGRSGFLFRPGSARVRGLTPAPVPARENPMEAPLWGTSPPKLCTTCGRDAQKKGLTWEIT